MAPTIISTGEAFGLLPFDLVDVILDIIAAHHLGLKSLKQCALVCKAWLDLCRPRIWASLSIYACVDCGVTTTTLQNRISLSRFSVIVYKTEAIGQLIRHIEYHDRIQCAHQKHAAPLPLFHALQYISNLSSFSLYISTPPRSGRKSQLFGIKLSCWCARTISRLDLHVSTNIEPPISLVLENATNLKRLYIHYLESWKPPDSQSTTDPLRLEEFGFLCNQPQIFGVMTANRNNGTPAIDFTVLEKAAFAIYDKQKFDVFQPLCDRSQRLVELELTLHIHHFQGLYRLLSPVLKTLQKLALIHKPPFGLEYEFLTGFARELQQLRGENRLQCINIVVELSMSQALYQFEVGDEYVLLDETLTSSGWPELKEVVICAKVRSADQLPLESDWKSELEIIHFHRLERSDQETSCVPVL